MTQVDSAAAAQSSGPQFNLQRVYLKDLSLEIPDAPAVFLDQAEPRLEFQIDTHEKTLQPGLFEVGVRCTVTCRLGEKTGFLVEATQAGIFEILGVAEDQLELLKGISCPSIIYPYLRANIADAIQRASFPPVHLAELNWEAFYQQRVAQQATRTSSADSGLILPTQ
ncbi:MAG: protein-export chaperone SecB [Burkholderiaceae bacterium]|nr:protein-export chaperone SecB [Burkholderiaceae bacterium]